jgi:dTDP-4-dehydrorhamnose reductase
VSGPLLVFGAGGQVGQELSALARARGVDLVGLTRAHVDIRDAQAVAAAVEVAKPRLVVNAAAYTAVDKAESEPDLAHAVNAVAPGTIAAAAARPGVPTLHISTDYVFDGSKHGAYGENDPIAPLGVYGRTKAEGEAAVRGAAPTHVILRTAWVYGAYGANFLKTMLRLAGERERLRVVADQHGCPTSTRDIAEAILAVDARLLRDPGAAFGTFHFAGSGRTSWHGFAEAIVAAQAPHTGRRPPVDAIMTADYPTPARRPANSELASDRFAATFDLRAASWRQRTQEVVAALLAR